MGNRTTIGLAIIAVLLLAVNIFQFYYYNYMTTNILAEDIPTQITELKGENWQDYINKKVTVEGYYFSTRNQYPMLVANPELLLIDTPVPNDKYVNITGTIPTTLSEYVGDRLNIKGTAKQAEETTQKLTLEYESHEHIEATLHPYLETPIHVTVTGHPQPAPNKYAILISGGYNERMAYIRYWNDLKYMYTILRNRYAYKPENIYAPYKDGTGEDTEIPVNSSATIVTVQSVFITLQTKMTNEDTLFIFANNHGGTTTDTNGDEPETYNKKDETLCLYYGTSLLDDQLAMMLNTLNYHKIIIFMKQCHAGGFIHDLSGPNRIILTSCTQDQGSYGADTEGAYGEFSYHFMKAVNLEVPADTDGNGWVSMTEAFNYASRLDSRDETPNFDDDGDQIGHMAPIPNGGDGTLGNNTLL